MAYSKAGYWGGALLDRSGNALLSVPFEIHDPKSEALLPTYADINRTPLIQNSTDVDGNAEVFAEVGFVRLVVPSTGHEEIIFVAATDVLGDIAAASFTYHHTQGVAAATWTINHNLNGYPSVTVVDSAHNVVEGEVQYPSTNQVVVKFSAGFSGEAFLS